jgi:hypothetical protein
LRCVTELYPLIAPFDWYRCWRPHRSSSKKQLEHNRYSNVTDVLVANYFNYAKTDVSAYSAAHASKYHGKILPHRGGTSL